MKRFCLIFLFIIIVFESSATHIIGGGFQMTHVRLNVYKFELVQYLDMAHGMEAVQVELENRQTVYIYEKGTNIYKQSLSLSFDPQFTNLPYDTTCQLNILQTAVVRYSNTILLNPQDYSYPEGYYVSYESCCRPGIIKNFQNPINTGLALYYDFPPLIQDNIRFVNSSPSMPDFKEKYALVGKNYILNFSNVDPDGDSLAYKLITPLAGNLTLTSVGPTSNPKPYPIINWASGYGVANIIPGLPSLQLDEKTGVLTVNPSSEGFYGFAVETEEYKNGIKIGSAIREFRIYAIEENNIQCKVIPIPDPEPVSSELFIIWPNPSKDVFNISFINIDENVEKIIVVNSLGEIILTIIPDNIEKELTLDLSALKKGLYNFILFSPHTIEKTILKI